MVATEAFEAGKYKSALETFQAAADLVPTEVAYQFGVASMRLKLGEPSEAITIYERLIVMRCTPRQLSMIREMKALAVMAEAAGRAAVEEAGGTCSAEDSAERCGQVAARSGRVVSHHW
jgi:predicted Zn-dependent protease